MVITLSWRVGEDDLHAAVGSVVGSLPLLAIAVPDIVRILLVKLYSGEKASSFKTLVREFDPISKLEVNDSLAVTVLSHVISYLT